MNEPSIVTPHEAQEWINARVTSGSAFGRLAYTVATESERHEADTRAAVVKALRWAADDLWSPDEQRAISARADAIENGADYA